MISGFANFLEFLDLWIFLKCRIAVVFWRVPHSLRWDITNICNFLGANIRLILEKAAISWQIIPPEKILRIFRDNPICPALFVRYFPNANLKSERDKCFSSICKFNLCKGISNLCLNGQIGKMSNWNPIYRSNRCNPVHVNYIVQNFHLFWSQ